MPQKQNAVNNYSFIQKVWIKAGIVTLIVIMLLLLKATFSVMLLIFAGALIAVFFSGLSGLIFRKTKWKKNICLILAVVETVLLVAGLS